MQPVAARVRKPSSQSDQTDQTAGAGVASAAAAGAGPEHSAITPSDFHSPRGPPKIRPLLPKKPQRRAPYACDECRLRKRACDTAKPCGPCRRSDTDCTYHFRRPATRPTTRIRALQEQLRQARGWLQHVQTKLPGGVPELDLNECLRILDLNSTLPDEDISSGSVQASRSSKGSSHSTPQGQSIAIPDPLDRFIKEGVRAGRSKFYYGPFSDVSFILKTVENLEVASPATTSQDPSSQGQKHSIIQDLIDCPLQNGQLFQGAGGANFDAYDLPPNTEDLISAVLARNDLMLSFLAESNLGHIAANSTRESADSAGLSLLHLVLALGCLYDPQGHVANRCDDAMKEAIKHFEIGTTLHTFGNATDENSLQALLCATYFLLILGRNTRAHAFIHGACSLTLRLGLFSKYTLPDRSEGPSPVSEKQHLRLLATVMSLDMMVSTILDLPNFLRQDLMPTSQISDLARRAEADNDLLTAALLRVTTLLAIPLSVRNSLTSNNNNNGPRADQAKIFQEALQNCQKWRGEAASMMARLGSTEDHQRVLKDLEATYHLSHIILFRPHLYYIRDMYAGQTISLSESHYALACIKAASSVILLAESLGTLKDSWLTIHAVFSSVMCLVFLVAAHPATTLPSVAWQRACRGIKLMAANKCSDNAPAISIEILKVVIHTLRETIYIDFDRIEASTVSRCNSKHTTPGYSGSEGSFDPHDNKSPVRRETHDVHSIESALYGEGHRAENEADKMLEQAEALEVDIDFQDYIYLDEGSD